MEYTLNNNTTTTNIGTANLWSNPELIRTIELPDSIEMIYKQTSMITLSIYPSPPPEIRIYKIIFSCLNGKWNKSEPIFGKVIPASDETYEF